MALQLKNSCDWGEVYQMSKKETLIARLRNRPRDFTVEELDSLMGKCGCIKSNKGHTSGSRMVYIHSGTGKKLRMHSPHPQKVLKLYMIDDALRFLDEIGETEEGS